MKLPEFTPSVSDEIRSVIEAEVLEIEQKHKVKVLFAVESGSRAWGFPSPDSDYDVRFIYARPVDWYLSIQSGRDVIELPIRGDLDINGWDIRKALGLLIKPNSVMLEWLSSPIRYSWDETTCAKLIEFARRTAHRSACLHHYLHLGESQWARHIGDRPCVNIKKYFYVLRPALAIGWIRLHPETVPPMNLQELVGGLDIEDETVTEIARLLHLKSQAREIGEGERIAAIDALILSELEWAQLAEKSVGGADLTAEADRLFRDIIKGASND